MVEAAGGTGEFFAAEMGDMTSVAALADWALQSERLDAMVHCAASFTHGAVSIDRFFRLGHIHRPSAAGNHPTDRAFLACDP